MTKMRFLRERLLIFYMRIPLTKYGLPEVLVYPAVVAALMIVVGLIGVAFLPAWAVASIEIMLTGVAVWVLSFFRDPQRPPTCSGQCRQTMTHYYRAG